MKGFYATPQWRKREAEQKRREPYCRQCAAEGRFNDGSFDLNGYPGEPQRRRLHADHIEKHGGDWRKFIAGALQTLCADHHDIWKRQIEAQGFSGAVNADGWPVDPKHPANKRGV